MAIQIYERQPDGTELKVQRWFHTGADGHTREVILREEGTGEHAGESYVASITFGWTYPGHRGKYLTYVAWVPDRELWYVTENDN